MRFLLAPALLSAALLLALTPKAIAAQAIDSDRDGLSDALEDALLAQFAPRFMVSSDDCSGQPAAFVTFANAPTVQEEDGTIYGQAFPRANNANQVELHYYHLWQSDCGTLSHSLDTEHVSVLLERDDQSQWKALYWYAAAHEDTVCDVSQITRAAAIDGEQHGPRVWISHGKHASFLSEALCSGGCGGDVCNLMEPLVTAKIINLGELSAPMNGATWVNSPAWPLAAKMGRSDFQDQHVSRLNGLDAAVIVPTNPANRQKRAIIHDANNTLNGAAVGVHATGSALNVADVDTTRALDSASSSTGGSLAKSYRNVVNALGLSARKTAKALGVNNASPGVDAPATK